MTKGDWSQSVAKGPDKGRFLWTVAESGIDGDAYTNGTIGPSWIVVEKDLKGLTTLRSVAAPQLLVLAWTRLGRALLCFCP